jgi:two-component system, cell cycle sensor histidine kinase and response regulator CckA
VGDDACEDLVAMGSGRPTAEPHDDALLRLVIDLLPIGIVVVDARGDIVLSNPAALHIWGETLLGAGNERWRRSRGCWHETGKPLEPDEWASARALSLGAPQLDQLVDIVAFDGTKRTIRNSAVPIIDGGVQGAVIVFENVTDRLQLAARLAQAQKLEAVGRLAGGVAHDFNNLLTVIGTYVDLTFESLSETDPRREDLDHVRTATKSATGLTRQLLAFARGGTTHAKDLVIEDEVRLVSKMLVVLLGSSVRLELRLDPAGNRARLDPSQLEQIFLNLALNARDAMPEGGALAIETRRRDHTDDEARLRGLPHGGAYVEIVVRDDGAGMDEPTRRRVFEPFFTTKADGRGTGLGLATVYAIVRDRGGAISIESEPGRGTTFRIELPLLRDSESVAVAPAKSP